jgi:hypothetical protein
MRIVQPTQPVVFQPVSIVLETEAEVQEFQTTVGGILYNPLLNRIYYKIAIQTGITR